MAIMQLYITHPLRCKLKSLRTAKPGKEKTASQNRFQMYCLDTIMMKIVSEVFPLAGN